MLNWEYYSCPSQQNRVQAGQNLSGCTLVSTESMCYYVSDENVGDPGHGGGGAGNNASLATDVINNFSDSCFTAVLNKIAANSLNNALSNILNNFYVGQNAELYFNNSDIGLSSVDADAAILNLPYNRFQITLNESAMVGASQEYIAATILHEVVHTYFNMSGISTGNELAQHQMMTKYIEPMSELIHYLFKDLSYEEADALAWGGLGKTDVWSTLTPAQQNSINSINQYYKNVNGTRANAPGTKCN